MFSNNMTTNTKAKNNTYRIMGILQRWSNASNLAHVTVWWKTQNAAVGGAVMLENKSRPSKLINCCWFPIFAKEAAY